TKKEINYLQRKDPNGIENGYRPLGAEMKQLDIQAQLTSDSDNDQIGIIGECENAGSF
ncbi:unnamed protein product, partial [Ilex paraguariensis]